MEKQRIKTGVCSIAFRELSMAELTEWVAAAGLDAIEWGGDVHVPHGDLSAAKEALMLTHNAGLKVSSYGSYCRVLDPDGVEEDFELALESALALETDVIRIWAGQKPSAEADDAYRKRVIEQTRRIAEQAAGKQIRIALEFHAMTLTDTNESAIALLDEVGHDNLYIYWQPIYWNSDMEYRLAGLNALRRHILNLHVFNWGFDPSASHVYEGIIHQPLSGGAADWAQYLAVDLPENLPHFALIEHVMGGTREQFMEDAKALKAWIR